MNRKIHSYFACFMALVLLVSTTSFKVEKHYCMGRLVDVAFFSDAQDCGMAMSLDENIGSTVDKMSCCNSELIAMEGQNDVKPSFNDFNLDQQMVLVAFVYSYGVLFEPVEAKHVPYSHYNPPKIIKDIQLLDAVFLI
ncbi:HYC_CC_PP family protein [Zobellia russellii]|uniref:HYC_CC_PP family protein n=1 Tax=Zobellia russellii TaxID=248907 RepID=UPI0037DBFD8A